MNLIEKITDMIVSEYFYECGRSANFTDPQARELLRNIINNVLESHELLQALIVTKK